MRLEIELDYNHNYEIFNNCWFVYSLENPIDSVIFTEDYNKIWLFAR